ncbi:MAG: RnfABCDGE type electron transport complex subunit D [Pseudomonadales bacterium]
MPDVATTRTRPLMLTVAACLLPGITLQAALIAPAGVAANLLTAVLVAAATERACQALRGNRPGTRITDSDAAALVTALILAVALPPGAVLPVALATMLALALGRHAYGGLGSNVFNPAMVGYAAVLVSLPGALSSWPVPGAMNVDVDGLTGATVLTTFKYRGAATVADVWQPDAGFGLAGGAGYEWVALAYAAGGLWLFGKRIAAWRPAAGMLTTLGVAGLAGYDNGSSASLGSPAFHLASGGALMAACFVATDPVTHPESHRGQWLFGIAVGAMTFAVRAWGNYPDGIAFGILLGNALTPYLDRRLSRAPETDHG